VTVAADRADGNQKQCFAQLAMHNKDRFFLSFIFA
jgi:hypothetical protein